MSNRKKKIHKSLKLLINIRIPVTQAIMILIIILIIKVITDRAIARNKEPCYSRKWKLRQSGVRLAELFSWVSWVGTRTGTACDRGDGCSVGVCELISGQ